jgi:hypothetical protein
MAMTLAELRAELKKWEEEYGVPGDTKVKLVIDVAYDKEVIREDLDSVDWHTFITHEGWIELAGAYKPPTDGE